jgi:hypothetical protein
MASTRFPPNCELCIDEFYVHYKNYKDARTALNECVLECFTTADPKSRVKIYRACLRLMKIYDSIFDICVHIERISGRPFGAYHDFIVLFEQDVKLVNINRWIQSKARIMTNLSDYHTHPEQLPARRGKPKSN